MKRGQDLRKQETFSCSFYGALLTRAQFPESPQSCSYVFFGRSTQTGFARKIYQGLLEMPLSWSKRFHFLQITLSMVFSSFGWAFDILPMTDYLSVVGKFLSGFYHLRLCVAE